MKKILAVWLLLLFLVPLLFWNGLEAKDTRTESSHQTFGKKYRIPDPALQRAIGILEKGKLKTSTSNYGIFTGFGFSGDPYPEGLWGRYQYISMISLLFGVPGRDENGNPYPWAVGPKSLYSPKERDFVTKGNDNTYWGPSVSESFMDRTSGHLLIDWEAVEDAATRLHGSATAGEVYGGIWAQPDDPTPLIATSDIPKSWPIHIDSLGNEERYWPGPWALDTSGVQQPGVFVSDEDVYFEFDDRLASRDVNPDSVDLSILPVPDGYEPPPEIGYPLGIKALVSAYSYGSSVAEDIIFFNMRLVNLSQYHYEKAWAGFYFDVDSYHRTYDGSYVGRTNDDDMMSFNTDWDFAYIWDLDDNSSGATNLAYAALKLLETPRATEPVDLDGDGIPDIQVGEKLGLTDWHWFDWYFRPGADDGGPNGPFTGDGETPTSVDAEAIIYKVMSGDTSSTDSPPDRHAYNMQHYFHPDPQGRINPHFDSYASLKKDYPDGLDCVFIMSSGPFSFAPGDTVPFSFAIIMGQDSTDLVVNAQVAQLMYDNFYRGPTPPTAPNVTALEGDREVTLFWDDVSINSRDALTKIKDFEGFRIYKSTDNGMTWGEKRHDDSTGIEYWVPVAQFDLDNEIKGYDPTAPHRFLGSNTGLQFQWTDTDVENGREYLYAVCAYDRGFIAHDPVRDSIDVTGGRFNFRAASLENFLSNSDRLPHIVRVIPHRPPSNVEQSEVEITKIDTTKGNGQFEITVVDQSLITGDEYLILFHAQMANGIPVQGTTTYDLINLTKGDTLLKNSTKYIPLDVSSEFKTIPPRIDGLEWTIKSAVQTEIDRDHMGWTENSNCNYEVSASFVRRVVSDYYVVFTGEGADNAYSPQDTSQVVFQVPFQVWNKLTVENKKLTPRKAKITVFDTDHDGKWSSKDKFFLLENHLVGYPDSVFVRTLSFTFTWSDTPYYNQNNQLIPANKPWAVGDTLLIPVFNPFQEGDGFIVNTSKIYQVKETTQEDIKKVKVVPNPYIVHAGWEFNEYSHKLQFTNLPSKCTIYIFNVNGELVQTLHHDSIYDGSEDWNLWTVNRQEVAPGLYVWVVETPDGKKDMGKFVIIR